MPDLEEITNKEQVINLGPDDLIIHARHLLLSAAKDLIKRGPDYSFGISCCQSAEKLEESLEVFYVG